MTEFSYFLEFIFLSHHTISQIQKLRGSSFHPYKHTCEISPLAKSAMTWEMSLMTSMFSRLAKNHEDCARHRKMNMCGRKLCEDEACEAMCLGNASELHM